MLLLKQKTVSGLGWSMAGSIGKQGLQFAISIVLARLLTPEDFGLIGMIVVFIGIANLFSDLGLGSALIQMKSLEEKHLSSVYWLNLGVGFLLTVMFMIIAPLIANFYDEPQLESMVRYISVVFFIGAMSIVQKNLFFRSMRFKMLSVVEILAILIAGIIAISLAFSGFGVWSLVAQLVSFTALTTAFLWILSNWRPRFLIELQAIRELWPFSSNLLGAQILNGYLYACIHCHAAAGQPSQSSRRTRHVSRSLSNSKRYSTSETHLSTGKSKYWFYNHSPNVWPTCRGRTPCPNPFRAKLGSLHSRAANPLPCWDKTAAWSYDWLDLSITRPYRLDAEMEYYIGHRYCYCISSRCTMGNNWGSHCLRN
jgi:hypothetical protein